MEVPIGLIVAFILGSVLSVGLIFYFILRLIKQSDEKAIKQVELVEKEADIKIREAQTNMDKYLEVRRKELEAQLSQREMNVTFREKEVDRLVVNIEEDQTTLEEKRADCYSREEELSRNEHETEKLMRLFRMRLYRLTGMSNQEAKQVLFSEVDRECREELGAKRKELLEKSEKEIEFEAKRILVDTMQRISSTPDKESGAAIVKLPSDEMKGRIIGKDGRNIRAFEGVTGTTLMIDETPDSVLISSFDSMRREIARIALEALLKDGRIHPASIENEVHKAEDQISKITNEKAEDALNQLKIKHVHPELVKLLGNLYFRLSYNQNTLNHSVEVAFICSLLASELQLDPDIAKRCGLFHDLGKVMSEEEEGSHAVVAANMLQKYGEDPQVVNAVAASHEEVQDISIYSPLLKVADAISAVRPGARADSMDGYVQRIFALEEIAKKIDGVKEVYALQAGRELRVIVEPSSISEMEAQKMARKIRSRIEEDLTYPDTIKVTLIRESRFSETAK